MQLKLKRSQRIGGVISRGVLFCIDARADFAPEEHDNLARYNLYGEVLYNSEAQLRLLEKSKAQQDGSLWGNVKALGSAILASTKLFITVRSLERGQHIECESLEELVSAEEALMQACQNLQGYLETAKSFDGREVLIDFSSGSPEIIAQAVTPSPQLAVPAREAPRLIPLMSDDDEMADDGVWVEAERGGWRSYFDPATIEMARTWFDTPAKRWGVLLAAIFTLSIILRS